MRRIMVLFKNILDAPRRIFKKISVFCILQDAKIDKTASICSEVKFYRSKIGKYSYIGNKSYVSDTDIGKFTSISTNCYIGGPSHPIYWVSTSPVFNERKNILKKNLAKHKYDAFKRSKIGNDVWIGNGVMVKAGVEISDGAIIGMGSVVTKNVGPYEIWAGNPAKFIRKRFDDDTINFLLKYSWWDIEEDNLKEDARFFNDINYLKKIKGN